MTSAPKVPNSARPGAHSRDQPAAQPLVTALQLGQLLKAARNRRKLSQASVASRLGLSQNRISYLELHPDEISFKQLLAWCSVVGMELHLGERSTLTDSDTKVEW
jgi:HTH-type transcriptional regulator / antitoxin HipB